MQLVITATHGVAVRGSSAALWEEALRLESSRAALLAPVLWYWFSTAAEQPKKKHRFMILQFWGSEVLKSKCQQGYIPFRSFRGEFHPLPCLFQLTYIPWLMAPSFIFKAHHFSISFCFCCYISASDPSCLPFIYLFLYLFIWPHRVLVATCEILVVVHGLWSRGFSSCGVLA